MEIEGFPNYLVYEDGKIWSKKSKKYLKPGISKGYYVVCLHNKGKKHMKKVHRLVAMAYIPNPDNKPFIDHINRDRADNRLQNLNWATMSENNINIGVQKNNKLGIKHISKLPSNTYVIQIRRNRNNYSKTCQTLEKAIIQRDLMLSMWP